MTRPRLGFLGIGLMGEAMVLRLRECDYDVAVWNLTPDRYEQVSAAGATVAPTPAALMETADVVLLCVLDGGAVENCVFGPAGLSAARAAGATLLIDHSTINPDTTRALAASLAAVRPVAWIDAPVSGGPGAARAGTLTIMAGGDRADFALAEPILYQLGSNVTHVGALGAGQAAKILNQAIVGTGYVLMAEVLALAESAGIDAALLPHCLAGGHADSAILRTIYPRMQARDFVPPAGYARQLLKDLKNVAGFADGLRLDLPLLRTTLERYAEYVDAGNEMADSASISRLYDRRPER